MKEDIIGVTMQGKTDLARWCPGVACTCSLRSGKAGRSKYDEEKIERDSD